MSSYASSITTNPDVMYVCDAPVYETNEIHRMNFTTGQKISSVTMTGTPMIGCTGLAVDPTDGTYYIGIKTEGDGSSYLGTIDPVTGVVTSIGEVEETGFCDTNYHTCTQGNGITNLAFNSTGHLFANSNRFPQDLGEVYRLDKTTGIIENTCTPVPNQLSMISIYGSIAGTDDVVFWNSTEFHGLGQNATSEFGAEYIPNAPTTETGHRFQFASGLGLTYYTLGYNWSTDQMFIHAHNNYPTQMWELTDLDAFDCGVVPHNVMTDNAVSELPFFAGIPQSMTFDTVTNSFYANVASWTNYVAELVSISPTAESGVLSSELVHEVHTNQVPSPPTNLQREAGDYHEAHIVFDDSVFEHGDGFFKGTAFELILTPPDTVAPVISTTESQPITIIQGSSFNAFEFVDCNDDVDGAITPNGNFWYVGGLVDTSIRGSQTVDYTCTDSADNNTLETVSYLVKKASSSGGTSSSSSTTSINSNTGESIPQLSDIPTLSFQDSPSQQGVDEGSSINDLFSNLFSNRLNPVEPTDSQPVNSPFFNSPQSSGSPSSERASPVADFFSNLFANLFS